MRLFFTYGQKTCLINIGPFLAMASIRSIFTQIYRKYCMDYYPDLRFFSHVDFLLKKEEEENSKI